jgi:hypothetical protein
MLILVFKVYLIIIVIIIIIIYLISTIYLMSTISANTTITQTILNGYTWPVTINGGTVSSPVMVKFGENLTLSGGTTRYFNTLILGRSI